MKNKARRSLKAALLLLDSGFADAAASRLYYAAFQAAIYAFVRQGRDPGEFRPGARGWSHRMIRENAALVRGIESDAVFSGKLYRLRLRADYGVRFIERRWIEYLRREVERFVRGAIA